MDRLKRSDEGFTLLELIIAIVLFAAVLFGASTLLISFGNFSSNVVKSEAALTGTSQGVFEEIVGMITAANVVAIPSDSAITVPNTPYPTVPVNSCQTNDCIEIRVSPTGSGASAVHTGDTVYTYWKSGSQLYKSVGTAAGSVIAGNIYTLSFSRPTADLNSINVVLESQTTSGTISGVTKEHLETTVIMRARSAN